MNHVEIPTDLPAGIVRATDRLPRGHVRIQTELVYPDGSYIDVFARNDRQLNIDGTITLTDMGNTTAWLLDLRIKPWLSQKRKRLVEDVLTVLRVRMADGALELDIAPGEPFGPAVLRLAQACLRITDLAFTQRNAIETVFRERVEDFFMNRDLPYEPDVEIPGKRGKLVRVDYRVAAGERGGLLFALGSANPSAAHGLANEIFSRWYDLQGVHGVAENRVTVFDDSIGVYREDDLARLRDFSTVVPFSNPDALAEALAA